MKKTVILFLVSLVFLPLPAEALEIIVGLPYGNNRIGHTAVRVYSPKKKEEVVYDFGRYGKTWGYLRFHGEGVVRVWRGSKQVARYLEREMSFRSSIGYTIAVTPEEEERIYQYYEEKLTRAKWQKKYADHMRYRLARDYQGIDYQCTSFSLDSFKQVWPKERWEKMLPPRFNKGQGFNEAQHAYFFKVQKELGLNEVVVPLDVIEAFDAVKKEGNPDITKVTRYPLGGRYQPDHR